MTESTLTISGRGQTHQAELNAKGTIVGRSARCDVVIEGRDISREHARIFEDPFGRWIFEDLGSSNGIFYNGKRVEACAVLGGGMSQGFGLTEGFYPSVTAKQPQITRLDIEELLKWLAEIWLDPEVREAINEDAWLKFMESVAESSKEERQN